MERRPSEFELAIDGSVLRQPLARWVAVIGLLLVLALSLLQLLPLGDFGRPVAGVVAAALGIGAAVSVIGVLVIRYLDRREPEPWFMIVVAFLWGGVVTAALASFVEDRFGTAAGIGPLVAAPVIVQTANAVGLLLILLLLRAEFNGARDGFVYGALIGLGSTWYSTAQGIGATYAATGDAQWAYQFLVHYPLAGVSGQTLFGALLGVAIGVAVQQHDRMRAAWWVAGGFVAAIGAQLLWALAGPALIRLAAGWFGAPVSERSDVLVELAAQPVWIGWLAVVFATVVTGLPFAVLVAVGLRVAGTREHRMLRNQLADERDDVITPAERLRLEETADPPRGAAGRIARLQNELATRKAWLELRALDPDSDRHVQAYRDELRALR